MNARARASLRGVRPGDAYAVTRRVIVAFGIAALAIAAGNTAAQADDPCGNTERCVVMEVESTNAAPGAIVELGVKLRTRGQAVASNTAEIVLGGQLSGVANDKGRGDCAANPAVDAALADFRFSPLGCAPDSSCTGVRGVILTSGPIADGTTLFTCHVRVAPGASMGGHSVTLTKAAVSDPTGVEIPVAVAAGSINVSKQESGSAQSTSSSTSSDGACSLGSGSGTSSWATLLLLVPLLVLGGRRFAMRRR